MSEHRCSHCERVVSGLEPGAWFADWLHQFAHRITKLEDAGVWPFNDLETRP